MTDIEHLAKAISIRDKILEAHRCIQQVPGWREILSARIGIIRHTMALFKENEMQATLRILKTPDTSPEITITFLAALKEMIEPTP